MSEGDDGFFDALKAESNIGNSAPDRDAGNSVDLSAVPVERRQGQTRVNTGVNIDHDNGVIVEGPDGKDMYAPLYAPDPDEARKRARFSLRAMDSFGDPELEQIVNSPGRISLFLAELPEKAAIAYQVEQVDMPQIIIIAQGGMVWEKDPGWSRFFKAYTGTPSFSRGGTLRDSTDKDVFSPTLESAALKALRGILKAFA